MTNQQAISVNANSSGQSRLRKCAIIIPTYNASYHWQALREGVERQGVDRSQVLVIDSDSTDDTRSLVDEACFRMVVIPKTSFRHGTTRQLAATTMPEAEYLVYLTQDAVLCSDLSVAKLLQSFDDPDVGAAYGRQLPRAEADAIERHARLFNYPAGSAVRDFESRKTLGFRSAYFSNSFAAYRRTAFDEVGGFPENVITSEDVSVAARMLLDGWSIAYRADAEVIHSHPLSISAEFSRYFDIAVHHHQESWIIEKFGSVGGEGLRFIYSELRYLQENAPGLIPLALLRTAGKYAAYQLGSHEQLLPRWLKRGLSLHPGHWPVKAADSFRALPSKQKQ